MRRTAFLLLALLPSRAAESPDAPKRLLAASAKVEADPPATAETAVVVEDLAGETADTEGALAGALNHLPSHAYLSLKGQDYATKAARVRDGWAFRRILSDQRGEKAPDRQEMDCWRRGKMLLRTKGKGYEAMSDEAVLEPAEVLKGLVEKSGGTWVLRMKDLDEGWKAEGNVLTWSSTDPKVLDRFARSAVARKWLKELRKAPSMKGAEAKGTLEITLGRDGHLVKAVRRVEVKLPCRESKTGGCIGCVMKAGESVEGAWGWVAAEAPKVPEEVAKRIGWGAP